MEALEFLSERKRMCNSYKDCEDCPLDGYSCTFGSITSDEDYKKSIATIEQWSKEHPRKTRQSVFLEQWPDAQFDENGNIKVCPKFLTGVAPFNDGCICNCYTCRKDFWSQEVK